MNDDFELVYMIDGYYDGPRSGIASFKGTPHYFESQFDDVKDDYSDSFLLTPLDPTSFKLAMEDWEIWRRWEQAFSSGQVSLDDGIALPIDRKRHEEIQSLLKQQLRTDKSRAVPVHAVFERQPGSSWDGLGWPPLQVKWTEFE